MKNYEWVTLDQVLLIHEDLINQTGGIKGLRDRNLLESALARPLNSLSYELNQDIFDLAAEYSYGIIRNHPFVDGNKRSALTTAMIFLHLNKYNLNIEVGNEQTELVQKLASSNVSKSEFADFLRENCKFWEQKLEIPAVSPIIEKAGKKPRLR